MAKIYGSRVGVIVGAMITFFLLAACDITPISPDDFATPTAQVETTPPPFCRVDGAQCSTPVEVPDGFTLLQGTTIAMPVAGGSPVQIRLEDVVQSPGGGSICCGVAAVATSPVTLYRAWAPHYDALSPAPSGYVATFQFGHWWSADQPDLDSHATYRGKEDICVAWNSLTVYTACTLQPGTQVFIGPGQSVSCDGGAYVLPASTVLQIYVPNFVDPETGEEHPGTQGVFNDCQTFVWPEGD